MIKTDEVLPDGAEFPGLLPPRPGVRIVHQVGGPINGGSPIPERLKLMSQLVSFKKTFKKGDTPLQFIEKRTALMNAFRRSMPDENLYTYASYFGTLTPNFDEQVQQLCDRDVKFESMEEWLEEFAVKACPNVASHAAGKLLKCRQESGESAIEFYDKARALLRICARTESSFVYEFVRGLKSQNERYRCRDRLWR